MVNKKKIATLINILLIVFSLSAQNKKALLIGVSEYKHWTTIESENNILYYKLALKLANYKRNNITVITNKKADSQGIINELLKLERTVVAGDNVFIAFCGHGTNIEDFNKDEIQTDNDGLDEVLVSYDTPAEYMATFNYITDDTINYYLTKIRKKASKTGQVIFIAESCLSGGVERRVNLEYKYYNYGPPIVKDFNPDIEYENAKIQFEEFLENKSIELAPLVVMTACQPYEKARIQPINNSHLGEEEIMIGLFTYAFCSAFIKSNNNWDYNKLFQNIKTTMDSYTPFNQQNPYSIGDLNIHIKK